MGVDLYLQSKKCNECGHVESVGDDLGYTYNVGDMWREIYPEEKLLSIDEMTGQEAYKKLKHAHDELLKNPDKFKAMNPPNGWGSYDTFLTFIEKLMDLSSLYPDYIWHTWR